MNPHDDGIGLDVFVDWLIEPGTIERIDDYGEWLRGSRPRCAPCPSGNVRLGAAAAAHLPAPAEADPRRAGADRPVPRGGRRRKSARTKTFRIPAPIIDKYVTDLRSWACW